MDINDANTGRQARDRQADRHTDTKRKRGRARGRGRRSGGERDADLIHVYTKGLLGEGSELVFYCFIKTVIPRGMDQVS